MHIVLQSAKETNWDQLGIYCNNWSEVMWATAQVVMEVMEREIQDSLQSGCVA